MANGDISAHAGVLRLMQLLLNTRYGQRTRLHDVWPDRAAMEDWLRDQRLITAGSVVTEGDFRRAIALRESLRHLLRRTDAGTLTEDALSTIRGMASHLLLKVQMVSGAEARLEPESEGVDGFLARVLAEMYTAMATGTWTQLKICNNSACSRAFYDRSRNHSAVWCSSGMCGNRMHARTYRQQRKTSLNPVLE
jgi:predicted RNA-binding Zn ribbon-like protein